MRETLAAIAEALNAGALERAGELLAGARQAAPDDPNVRLFDAMLARGEGRIGDATAWLSKLADEAPGIPQIEFQLGNCLKDRGELEAAALRYRKVLGARPDHVDAAFNLGACLAGSDPAEAGYWFVRAVRGDFRLHDGYMQVLSCALRCVRAGQRPPAIDFGPADRTTTISVVSCSITPERLARLRESCEGALAGGPWELVHVGDARSLSEGYTRGIAQARGEVLILCHDDVRLLAPDFRPRLLAYLRHFELVGPAGTTRAAGPSIFWSGPPHAHNWVMYPGSTPGTVRVQFSSVSGPVVPGAQALDGLLLAGPRRSFERIGFDAATFDGFHHYDLDFSYRAWRAGLRTAICLDLLVEHASEGSYDQRWRHYADAFVGKFPELGREPFSDRPTAYEMRDTAEADAVAMLAWIGHWQRQANATEAAPAPR